MKDYGKLSLATIRGCFWDMKTISFLLFFLPIPIALEGAKVTRITVENSCQEPVWIAAVSAANSSELPVEDTGFVLPPTQLRNVSVPSDWSGNLWARTQCGFQQQHFFCQTGDCGSRGIACPRGSRLPLATTFARFKPKPSSEYYSFYVSQVMGFNLAVAVVPEGGVGPRCRTTGCAGLHPVKSCPEELRKVDGGGNITSCTTPRNEIMGCFSANYHIEFCPNIFCQLNSPPGLPDLSSHKSHGRRGRKTNIVWPVFGAVGSLSAVVGAVWWFRRRCILSLIAGCCAAGCCNHNNLVCL